MSGLQSILESLDHREREFGGGTMNYTLLITELASDDDRLRKRALESAKR
jgi:hypothetical protein